ncbi:hypothetical protein [Candidatus Nanogingivalis gingivitcus]|jgi:hypothetical protein|uniref:Uncharacterized protein n=1 Tax=Candidatus Nanogingivalis gingivitcus TaxID=2171992 RepID=A0ABY0FHF1_9BACT|nr:hypothetical protein [Candidatus Nanogingivalis gingivitcus]RYC72400.1 hypothetical protein G6CMJM_00554 [Candidatus Nanogingivalis gingivitcus]
MQNNQINLTQDNIISTLARLSIQTKTSQKNKTNFHIITLHFKNGLEIDYFIDKKIYSVLKML